MAPWCGLPFPNNTIPASRIDPTAAIIQNMIPLPNTPGVFNYTAPGYSNFRHTTIPSIKIDRTSQREDEAVRILFRDQDLLAPEQRLHGTVYRACSRRTLCRRPYASTWIRRSLQRCFCTSAPAICTRPILRPLPLTIRKQLFPEGRSLHCEQLLPLYGGHV